MLFNLFKKSLSPIKLLIFILFLKILVISFSIEEQPIKFIFLVALNENFEKILLDKITYTPVHEFYLEYQKEILQRQIRIENRHRALAYAEEQAKLKKAEKKILKNKLHLKKIEDQKARSKRFSDFITKLTKSDIEERFNLIINSPFGIAAVPKEFFEICNSDQFIKVFKSYNFYESCFFYKDYDDKDYDDKYDV